MSYDECLERNFRQASIYLDACFILAFLDEEHPRCNDVSNLVMQWYDMGIDKIGLSNHIYSEVVFNLFKNRIIRVLELSHLMATRRKVLSDEEALEIGDISTANYLRGLVSKDKLERIVNKKKPYHIDVMEIIKIVKVSNKHRVNLSIYYDSAINAYESFVRDLQESFNFETDFLNSDFISQIGASRLSTNFLLDIYDALHLAIAEQHGYSYLATLDSDFTYLTGNKTVILKIG
ncbi:PIN domain-containing protein [Ammoniphilus sp. YIM 78166]|uniref:PIN domain-containing protein n=1 Tax=Ammoniphilus sp. YIM 78166 TaxID=1644106 RepID=UPI001431BD98|nr:PIN domain-containing protein [Ammoniphilus sp. YIM 78166]